MDEISAEILNAIFSFLSTLELLTARTVCKLWKAIIDSRLYCGKCNKVRKPCCKCYLDFCGCQEWAWYYGYFDWDILEAKKWRFPCCNNCTEKHKKRTPFFKCSLCGHNFSDSHIYRTKENRQIVCTYCIQHYVRQFKKRKLNTDPPPTTTLQELELQLWRALQATTPKDER